MTASHIDSNALSSQIEPLVCSHDMSIRISSMKVAHLMIGNGWGGVQSFFRDCCKEMSARGLEVLAVVRTDSWLHKTMPSGERSLELISVKNRFGNYDWLTIEKFRQNLIRFNPDIVVSHGQRSTLFASKVKKANNCDWPQVSLVQASLKQKYYKGADLLIPHTKSQANLRYHVDLVNPNFSEVIPLFTSIKHVTKVNRSNSIKHVFSAGRLHVNKGYKYLLEAVDLLRQLGLDLQLTIAGDGPEMQNLIHQRDRLRLESNVNFIGASNNITELMRQSDLFVLPSISEPFGIVLLEAMASGVPIVATKTNGPLEIFDESSAILVDAMSGDALSKGILKAIENQGETIERTHNALNLYREQFSADVVVPKFIKLFERCIDQHKH